MGVQASLVHPASLTMIGSAVEPLVRWLKGSSSQHPAAFPQVWFEQAQQFAVPRHQG